MTTPRTSPVRGSNRHGVGGRVAFLSVALALLLTGCGPPTVSLTELVVEADNYDGHEIVTHGVVAEFGEEDGALEQHFVIRDAAENRVQLLPDEAAEPHVGSAVEVTGEFDFDPQRGRALHVDAIEVAQPGS